jgi:hypothetical protein
MWEDDRPPGSARHRHVTGLEADCHQQHVKSGCANAKELGNSLELRGIRTIGSTPRIGW